MQEVPQLYIYEEELIKLIEEYLASRNYNVSVRTLEKESSVINYDYSDEVLFLRELVLDGDFDEVLQFGESLKSNDTFDKDRFSYVVLRQKFIELIYLKAHILDKQNINTIGEVMRTLSKLEKFCKTKEEYNNLCWLLTLPDLNSHEEFAEWNVDVSRLKCFNDLLECLSSFMPLAKRKIGSNKTASKDRLLQLIIKGLFYESCTEYCQTVANSLEMDAEGLNLQTDLLDTSNSFDNNLNLLSWIAGLPVGVFELPFNLCDIDICYSRPNGCKSKQDPFSLNKSLSRATQNSKSRKQIDSRDTMNLGGMKSKSFDNMQSSKILSSSFPTSELRRGLHNSVDTTGVSALHASLNIGRNKGRHQRFVQNEFKLASPNVPPVMSSSAIELSPQLNKEPIMKQSEQDTQQQVRTSQSYTLEKEKEHAVRMSKDHELNEEKYASVDLTHAQESPNHDLEKKPQFESTPPVKKKPVAFELFEEKSPDKELDEKKRREEVLDKLKKHEQSRHDSLKSLLSDGSPACTSSKPTTPVVVSDDNLAGRPNETPQRFKFSKRDTLDMKKSNEMFMNETEEQASSIESKENSDVRRPRGPVINGVRHPPRSIPPAEDFPVLSERKVETAVNTRSRGAKENRSESYGRSLSYEHKNVHETRASYDVSERTLVADIVPQYKPISMLEDTQAIRSVCFHPDGQLHVIGANSKVVRICKTDTKKCDISDGVSTMEVVFSRTKYHRGSIYCMAWDTEGRLLATGSNDKTIKIIQFDAHNYTQLGDDVEFNIHTGTVRELAFVPHRNGYLISGGSGSGSVNITDVTAQKVVGTFDGHSGNILTVYAGNAGEVVATGGTDNTLRLWDLRSQRCIDVIVVGDSSPASVALSSHNNYVASGQEDGSILLYDITAGRTLHTMRLHKSDCRSVRFSTDSNYLMTASYDSSISIMHIREDLEINPPRHYTVAQHADKVIQCRWHPTENVLLSSSADRTTILWKGSNL